MRAITFVLLLLSTLLLMSCSGGGGGPADSGGKVLDGYVQGAWVYVVPVGETTAAHALYTSDAQTDAKGNFSFSKIQDFITANAGNMKYQLISVGGTNTATGAPVASNTIYTAPLGSKVLTPLTTLVMQTATAMASGATLTQDNITQAVAQIAAVSGMTGTAADTKDVMLNMDLTATATTNIDASKAFALELIITKLSDQKVVNASADNFSQTVNALSTKLADTSNTPLNVGALVTSASLTDTVSQAQATIITESILNTVSQVTLAAQSQSSSVSSTPPAQLMATMEQTLTTNLNTNLSSVTTATTSTDVSNLSNTVTSSTTTAILKDNITNLDKTDSVADLTNSTISNYLLHKASEGGIAQLLGIDVLNIPSANVVTNTVARVANKLSAKRRVGKSVAATTSNPCSGVANSTPVALSCSDVLGADFCTATSGFQASLSCTNNLPDTITIALSGFNSPLFGSSLSGNIALNNNSMTLTGLTNGTTTFNGSLGYGSGANGSLDFAVKNMTVVSSMWKPLTLDSFSRGSIVPAANGGQNSLSVYISGVGTLAGSNVDEKLSLKYERSQDSVKTLNADNVYTDNATVTLNGQVSQGTDVVTLANFGLSDVRYYNAATDQDYLYKLSSFTTASKLATSKYGYAYFTGNGLKYNFDESYASGGLILRTTLP